VQIPGYEVLGELGRGGMGVVYKARQIGLDRVVALKMILAGGHAGEEELRRFQTEAEAVARLNHPNIVAIHEVGRSQGKPFLSLEFCPGGSLDRRLNGTPQSPPEAARLVATLAQAMQAAHEQNVIHRDLKPANVLLTADGRPKITDFGLAKKLDEVGRTASGAIMGTPSYMAPEQAGGSKELGPACDVYALGAILYELLTGRPPFRAPSLPDTLVQVMTEDPVSLRRLIPRTLADLETICLKCLHKDPRKRYPTALALAEDLQHFLNGEPIRARPVGRIERSWRWCRRNPSVATLTGLVVLTLLGGVGFSTYFAFESYSRAEEERKARDTAQQKERDARDAEKKAITNEDRARKAQQDADTKAGELARLVYKHRIALAQREWENSNISLVEQLLAQCDPKMRGWEWDYCHRLCRLELRRPGALTGVGTLSSDGARYAADCGEGHVRVWSVQTGQPICTITIPPPLPVPGRRYEPAFSPDGKQIGVGCWDGTVRLFDALTGKEKGTFRGPDDPVTTVAISPDGKRVAGFAQKGARDWWGHGGVVHVWDVGSGKSAFITARIDGAVSELTFSPDNRRLAGSTWKGQVRIWDCPTATETILRGHTGLVLAVAFSPEGWKIVSGSADGLTKIWDADGKELRTLRGHSSEVHHVAFSHDGRRFATCSADNTIKIWDLAAELEVLTLRGHRSFVHTVAFTSEDRYLVSAAPDDVRVWDVTADQEALNANREGPDIATAVFSPDNTLLAWPKDGKVKLTNPTTGQVFFEYPSRAIYGLAFNPDGREIVEAGLTGEVVIRQVEDGKVLRVVGRHGRRVCSVAWSRDGKMIASTGDGSVKLWDAATGKELCSVPSRPAITYFAADLVAFSPDGRKMAAPGTENNVRIWDTTTFQPVSDLKGHEGEVWAVAFSPNGERLVSGALDCSVRVWDVATGRAMLVLKGHTDAIRSVGFSPDGKRIVSGSQDRTVKIWDAEIGEELLTLRSHKGPVLKVAVSSDGRRIASTGQGGELKIWDATPPGPPPKP
jgi:WD40 repeat protein